MKCKPTDFQLWSSLPVSFSFFFFVSFRVSRGSFDYTPVCLPIVRFRPANFGLQQQHSATQRNRAQHNTMTPTRQRSRPNGRRAGGKSTADEARSIQNSLQRTQTLLQQELERVSHVSEAIDEDGKLLNQTQTHQLTMNDTVKGANAALRNLQLQKRKEFLVLSAAVLFFYTTVGYVLWTRIPLPF